MLDERGSARKNDAISEVDLHGSSRKLRARPASGANSPRNEDQAAPRTPDLIETMFEGGNLIQALQAVERNAGAAGVDGLETGQFRRYLFEHWDKIKEQILNGRYEPQHVRRVGIPKAGGGTRMLGRPTTATSMQAAAGPENE